MSEESVCRVSIDFVMRLETRIGHSRPCLLRYRPAKFSTQRMTKFRG